MNTSAIWKSIKSIVNIKAVFKKDISLINDNGTEITEQCKIANIFNNFFVNIGSNIDI